MKIVLIGANGTIGEQVQKALVSGSFIELSASFDAVAIAAREIAFARFRN